MTTPGSKNAARISSTNLTKTAGTEKRDHEKNLLPLLLTLLITLCNIPQSFAAGSFTEAGIPAIYAEILAANPDLSEQGGAKIVPHPDNKLVIVGVGKSEISDHQNTTLTRAQKESSLDAQLAVLTLVDGIKISSQRESQTLENGEGNNREALSRYAQIVEFLVEGKIMQLPVIGNWTSNSRLICAVGGILDRKTGIIAFQNLTLDKTKTADPLIINLDAEAPFYDLITLYRGLTEQPDGIRLFELEGQQILLAIGTAILNNNPAKAERLARIRAQKALLGHKSGIKLTRLTKSFDYEELHEKRNNTNEQYLHLSDFFRTSQEKVEGRIQSLPVVAIWNNVENTIIYVGLGEIHNENQNTDFQNGVEVTVKQAGENNEKK